jgi:hypothetical protein
LGLCLAGGAEDHLISILLAISAGVILLLESLKVTATVLLALSALYPMPGIERLSFSVLEKLITLMVLLAVEVSSTGTANGASTPVSSELDKRCLVSPACIGVAVAVGSSLRLHRPCHHMQNSL